MHRCRQVRLCYPQAYVELALLLARQHSARTTSRVLALPLSTFYRWLRQYPNTVGVTLEANAGGDDDRFNELITACESRGFDVRRKISLLNSTATTPTDANADQRQRASIDRQRKRATAQDGFSREQNWIGAYQNAAPATTHARNTIEIRLSPSIEGRLRLARREIELHYYSRLSCESLARTAAMSRFHFIKMFHAAFGISPYRYLMQVRVNHAKHLLDTTEQSLDAIAAAVGYESQSSLCRAFGRVEKISLSRYFHGVRLGSLRRGPRVHIAG